MANNNQNGQMILVALRSIEPATLSEIVAFVAEVGGVSRKEIKDTVEQTLEGGVHLGFIQRKNRRYFETEIDLNSGGSGDEDSEPDADKERPGLVDRSRRRRRGGRRSGSRRRRSRRRRSRR